MATGANKQARAQEALITVSETKFNQTTEDKKLIQIRPFATEPAHVCVKLGRTINLGNFESAKIDVMVDVPCYVEEVKRVYSEVMTEVQNLLSHELSKIYDRLEISETEVKN